MLAELEDLGLNILPIVAVLIFGYMVISTFFNFNNWRRNLKFVIAATLYYGLATLLLCLAIYGSATQMIRDNSHLQWGPNWALFPITLTNEINPLHVISKDSGEFSSTLFLAISYYVTIPQAIARSLNLYVLSGWARFALGTVFNIVGIGEGFLAFILLFTAIGSPVPLTNGWLLLIAGLSLVMLSGYDLSGLPNMGLFSFLLAPLAAFIRMWIRRVVSFIYWIWTLLVIIVVDSNIVIDTLGFWAKVTGSSFNHPNTAAVIIEIVQCIIGLVIVGAIAAGFAWLFGAFMQFLGVETDTDSMDESSSVVAAAD